MNTITINIDQLINEAVSNMESADDLNWSIGAAFWELIPQEVADHIQNALIAGHNKE